MSVFEGQQNEEGGGVEGGKGESTTNQQRGNELSTIEMLQGRRMESGCVVLGFLLQLEEGVYYLEDLNAQIKLNFSPFWENIVCFWWKREAKENRRKQGREEGGKEEEGGREGRRRSEE